MGVRASVRVRGQGVGCHVREGEPAGAASSAAASAPPPPPPQRLWVMQASVRRHHTWVRVGRRVRVRVGVGVGVGVRVGVGVGARVS